MSADKFQVPMTADAVRAEAEYLVRVGQDLCMAQHVPDIVDVGDVHYYYSKAQDRMFPLTPPDPKEEQQPNVFQTFSLDGLVDYIKADVDGIFSDESRCHIVRVTDWKTVEVITPVTGWHKKRYIVVKCEALVPSIPFDKYMDAETFQIIIQTRFAESDNRALVLKLAGNLKDEQSMQTADDGVSQRVTVKQGVATAADVTVKNPVTLTPLRTFIEVEQPTSPFILRFAEGAHVALFEGDGGAWKLAAVRNIWAYLTDKLDGCNVEVIA